MGIVFDDFKYPLVKMHFYHSPFFSFWRTVSYRILKFGPTKAISVHFAAVWTICLSYTCVHLKTYYNVSLLSAVCCCSRMLFLLVFDYLRLFLSICCYLPLFTAGLVPHHLPLYPGARARALLRGSCWGVAAEQPSLGPRPRSWGFGGGVRVHIYLG